MCTKKYCDYENYFQDQAGGVLDIEYRGLSNQRGYGRFSSLTRRYAMPALKYLFNKGIDFGKQLYHDIREGKEVKSAIKENLRKRGASVIHDIADKVEQMGKGIKRRKISKKTRVKRRSIKRQPRKSVKRRVKRTRTKKDIFI